MKSYKFLSHTADIRMKVEGGALSELFESAVLGMDEVLSPGSCVNNKSNNLVIREISIEAPDATALIVDFLSEVLTCSYEEKVIFCRIDFLKIDEVVLEAKIHGKKIEEFKEDIKAVTYHEADVRKSENGKWETMIVFDI